MKKHPSSENHPYRYSKKDTGVASKKLESLKGVKKPQQQSKGVRINAPRVDSNAIHTQRVLFNVKHFGCAEFYHQNGKKTWLASKPSSSMPMTNVKRIIQILVPSEFFYVTDKTRKKIVCKRGVKHEVISTEEKTVKITAHAENAVKEMLIKEGVNKDFILTKKNVCYVTLHKQVTEEKIRNLFPTLYMRVFKMKS